MRHCLAILIFTACCCTPTWAAEVEIISPQSQVFQCKESDWIYGDFLLRNDLISAVVAQPKKGRNANMTVRAVGACVIDLTLNNAPNDQLSCYYPTGGRFNFEDAKLVRIGSIQGDAVTVSDKPTQKGERVFLEIRSSSSVKGNLAATVRYELRDGESFLRTSIDVRDRANDSIEFDAYDGLRADRTFRFANVPGTNVAFAEDSFFGQTYGFVLPTASGKLSWKSGRMRLLNYDDDAVARTPQGIRWNINLVPATCVTDLWAATANLRDAQTKIASQRIAVKDQVAPVGRAVITLQSSENDLPGDKIVARDDGTVYVRLPLGDYAATVDAPGFETSTHSLKVDSAKTQMLTLPTPAAVVAKITDSDDGPVPCKVTFYGTDGTKDPDFGPDSTHGSVKNCVYSVTGSFRRTIDAGTYDVIISRGPEYDVVSQTIQVSGGKMTELRAKLKRTVDTPGWVSTELHSHSTPSGDNTSLQRGRVENLLCEHLEFAPCTEHNRIDTYTPHLRFFGLEHLMATCTGMELTGSPLPVNHQNAFPLHHHPHTQDGGGPTTDSNPLVQIERLAMWDNGADKVVQGNHPNIRQQYGDRDTDGKVDEGFRGMFAFMDVIEVHPPSAIFKAYDDPGSLEKNRMAHWMQLLNQGIRIPGVVNTDAHYNHHGSGWLRNWFESSSDDPATISVDEMIHAAEHGHIIMSTGPFMSVKATSRHNGKERSGTAGDDLVADDGQCRISVSVKCANWLDVNRVQIFLNGRSTDELNFTRRTHPDMFANGVTKFEQTIELDLKEDTHVIVATIGQGLELGRVMGEQYGKRPPCAVSNPIWVDVDGKGFQANGDGLGLPLPGAE